MTFQELPSDWAQRPITDVDVFEGVVDLLVSRASRESGALHVLLCHGSGRLMQRLVVETPDWEADAAELVDRFTTLFAALVDEGVPAVAVALARPGPSAPSPVDQTVCGALEAASVRAGVSLLGLAVAAPRGVVAVRVEREEHPRARHRRGDGGSRWLSA